VRAAPRPDREGLPWAALGLAAGPVAFVTAWVVGGARTPDYSPVHDAISRIAAEGAPHRATMTAGFVAYGVAVAAGATALRGTALHRTWPVVLVNGVATLAVAATPLEHSDLVDQLHAASATAGYVSIGLVPVLAAGPLRRRGHRGLARLSSAMSVAIAASLVATPFVDANGLAQRLGLGIGDVWLIATGLALFTGALALAGDDPDT
jgi:hypothetical protein